MVKTRYDLNKLLGYPNINHQQLGVEVWSRDFYADGGFSNASGEDTIEAIKSELQSKRARRTSVKATITSLQNQIEAYGDKWRDCSQKYSTNKKKRNDCKDNIEHNYIDPATTDLSRAKSELIELNKSIPQLESILATKQEQIKELARQGKTPQSIITEIQGKASRKKILVVGAVMVAVALVGYVIAKRMK